MADPDVRSSRSTASIAVGSRVRVIWPSTLEGLTGTVTATDGIHGGLAVRIDGERWRHRAPIPVARREVELLDAPRD